MKYIVGLDIGGTKITGIVWDGKLAKKEITVPTPHNLPAFKQRLVMLLNQLDPNAGNFPLGVGIAGLVDKKNGIIKSSPNLIFLKNFNLKKFLKSLGFAKVFIDNDVASFTLAELYLGAGKRHKNFLCMTLGTGVGGGMVIAGQPYRGYENFGGEFGKMLIQGGQFEAQFQKARTAKNFEQIGVLLGQACLNLINIFNPEAIILGGGIAGSFKEFKTPTQEYLRKYLNSARTKTPILVSKIKNAGAVGAALMCMNEK